MWKSEKETLDINVFTGGGKLINELIKLSSLIIYTSNYFVILNFRKQMNVLWPWLLSSDFFPLIFNSYKVLIMNTYSN